MIVTLCGRGLHEMTEENTLITHDGSKRCRKCRREAAKKRKEVEQSEEVFRIEDNDDNLVDFELPRGSLGRKWQADAKCRPMGNSKWFFAPLLEDDMVEYCQDCPVITLCWAYAVTAKESDGVWGGTTAAQRQSLPLERRIQVRKSYPRLYGEYLGLTRPEPEAKFVASEPDLNGREAVIQRGLEASDYADSMAHIATKNRMFPSLGGTRG